MNSFTSSTPGAAAAASVSGSAAPPIATPPPSVSWAAAPPPLRMRDGVPTARGGVAVVSLAQRVRSHLGEATPRIEQPSSEVLSAYASSPTVGRTGGHSCGIGTDHSTSQPNNNWISRSRSVFEFCNAACDCGEYSSFCNSR